MHRRSFLSGLCAATAVPSIPAIAASPDGRQEIVLTAQTATADLLGAGEPATPVWTFNQTTPGPELRIRQGEEVRIRLVNQLEQATSVHWHGLRIDNAMDGVANLTQDPVPPGETFEYILRPPDAGTYWYHSHTRSWEQVARGLYGALIVEEREPPGFAADVSLVLDDWLLGDDGAIHEASMGGLHDRSHGGRLGNWLTVNGLSQPRLEVPAGLRSRVRLLNACNARVLSLSFGDQPVEIIALDGQPTTPRTVGEDGLIIAPGQRVDVLLGDGLADEQAVTLTETSQDGGLIVATLAARQPAISRPDPAHAFSGLADNPLPPLVAMQDALRVPLLMEGGAMGGLAEAVYQGERLAIRELADKGVVWAFNGVVGMTEEPLFRVPKGRAVVLEMDNATAWPHAMHIHGHHFRSLSDNGEDTPDSPWRDTVLSDRGDKTHLGFIADNPGKWLIHCHMLEHHAGGMVTWFEVEG
jgi:FtsP/CotA-like multicopper oxidase with cupredoxin domain